MQAFASVQAKDQESNVYSINDRTALAVILQREFGKLTDGSKIDRSKCDY